jgi:hypothetical protein
MTAVALQSEAVVLRARRFLLAAGIAGLAVFGALGAVFAFGAGVSFTGLIGALMVLGAAGLALFLIRIFLVGWIMKVSPSGFVLPGEPARLIRWSDIDGIGIEVSRSKAIFSTQANTVVTLHESAGGGELVFDWWERDRNAKAFANYLRTLRARYGRDEPRSMTWS